MENVREIGWQNVNVYMREEEIQGYQNLGVQKQWLKGFRRK